MEISLSHLAGDFFGVAFLYMILAAQVRVGFPPFYSDRSWTFFAGMDMVDERATRRMIPFMAGIVVMLIMFVITELRVFFWPAGILSAWAGLWLRRDLFRATNGPLPWLTHPWTVRWPMIVFDLWTLGIALGFGFMILLSSR